MPLIAIPTDNTAAPDLDGDRGGVPLASVVLGMTPAEVRSAARRGQIPHFRIGRRIRFSRRALEAFVASGGTSGASIEPDRAA